jgi:hypothetical protein
LASNGYAAVGLKPIATKLRRLVDAVGLLQEPSRLAQGIWIAGCGGALIEGDSLIDAGRLAPAAWPPGAGHLDRRLRRGFVASRYRRRRWLGEAGSESELQILEHPDALLYAFADYE